MRSKNVSVLDEYDNLKGIRHIDIVTQNILEQYYHMTVVACYREWIRGKRVMPLNDIIKLTAKLVKNGLSQIESK